VEFCFEHVIPAALADVFAFHADPANLAALFGSRSGFRLLHHDGGVEPGSTTWVEERIAWVVPVVLGFRHVLCDPPHRFGEELFHGPYERFVHVHEFEARGDGTLVRDRLEVRVPWHSGGRAAMCMVIAPRIRQAFAFRQQALRRLVARGMLAPARSGR
jgi:ligand-binding SRPBCC domain-containing protein